MIEMAHDGLADQDPAAVWCLKVHRRIRGDSPNSRFISTFRDPRDAIVSYMRFTRCDFDRALAEAESWTELCDHYRSLPSDIALSLDYDEIDSAPATVAGRMVDFLGLEVNPGTVATIVSEFAREGVRRRIDAMQEDVKQRHASGEKGVVDSLVANADGTIRALDRETGFQSHHVSDYKSGGWRSTLSAAGIDRLHGALGGWLTQNGYEL